MCLALEQLNRQTPQCEFDAIHINQHSKFTVRTTVAVSALTTALFGDVLRMLMPRIATLDRDDSGKRGYVR